MTQSQLPSDYPALLADLKLQIQQARVRSRVAVNHELVMLYWHIGRQILERQAQAGWGAKVITQLSRDLRKAFPEMTGLSDRNLKYMRKFAETYPDELIVQRTVAQLPWGHNIALFEKLKDLKERQWYAAKTLENGWSRDVLIHQIANGFAFVGNQVHLEVGGDDFYVDLLFYHLHLHRYIVIELKRTAFIPEYVSKVNFYCAVIDDQLRHRDDDPTIGLILCKDHNRVVAEYALGSSNNPEGVARYSLPKELEGVLPSVEELEAELTPEADVPSSGKEKPKSG